MPVEDPGVLTVTCDRCHGSVELNTTELAGDPASWCVDDETLHDEGWSREGSETFCPSCSFESSLPEGK